MQYNAVQYLLEITYKDTWYIYIFGNLEIKPILVTDSLSGGGGGVPSILKLSILEARLSSVNLKHAISEQLILY